MSTCPRLASPSGLLPRRNGLTSIGWRSGTPDLSQFRGYVPRADATYAFDRLDRFGAEPGRQGWMTRSGLTLAGFAMTGPLESAGTSMDAFFIERGLRRHGVGLPAARELWGSTPGCGASPSRTRTLMRSRSGSVSPPTPSVTDGAWRTWPDLKDTYPTSGSASLHPQPRRPSIGGLRPGWVIRGLRSRLHR
jgi:hypothetical protein